MSEIVYLSLGSNIGDRESNIAGAITALGTYSEIHNVQSASFYETEPLYNQDQPLFLNTVVCCSTEFSPFQFLDAIKDGEDSQKTLDKLGLKRYCCRRMIISNVDVIDLFISTYRTKKISKDDSK